MSSVGPWPHRFVPVVRHLGGKGVPEQSCLSHDIQEASTTGGGVTTTPTEACH